MRSDNLRVAFFPDAYHEVDGVANTSRHFESFARARGLPFLVVHSGPQNEVANSGSVTRIQLRRSPLTFPLDGTHAYDLLFIRHYRQVSRIFSEFAPDVVQITGPSDVGVLGAVLAHRFHVPLAASWQTNLHQYARTRLSGAAARLPDAWAQPFLDAVEHWSFRATARFYKIPRLLFAPNQELVASLSAATGKPCFLMSHSVDTERFTPAHRNRPEGGPLRIGYVGRLMAEKNVRWLARLEKGLLEKGITDFRFVIVGHGGEQAWLREHMSQAEFTGLLTGSELAHAFADMDIFAFPSQTDTFGLAVLEALASGVPAVVTSEGGPKYTVQHGKTGFVANNFDEFLQSFVTLSNQPALLSSMRTAAREYALSTSWEGIFEGMYRAYEHCLPEQDLLGEAILDVANT